jgi:hypothetical protein
MTINKSYAIGMTINTIAPVYGSTDKKQIANLTKIPAGSFGEIRWIDIDRLRSTWLLCVFQISGKTYYARLAPSIVQVS